MTKPLIGVTADWQENGSFSDYPHYALREHYSEAIAHCGGVPILLPYIHNEIEAYADIIDGLLIPGGLFAFPDEWYIDKETASPYKDSPRLAYDKALLQAMIEQDKPVLGVCAGMQLIAGVMGCKLTGNVHNYYNTKINHWDAHAVTDISHDIIIHKGGVLESLCPSLQTQVNSHHQEAVVKLADSIRVEAVADDNVIEAISLEDRNFVVGVQWHPEVMVKQKATLDYQLISELIYKS